MAMAKDLMPSDSSFGPIQGGVLYANTYEEPSPFLGSRDSPPLGESPEKGGFSKNFNMSNSSSTSSPSSSNSNGLGYQPSSYIAEEGQSVISFKPEYGNVMHDSGSFLSFEQSKQDQPCSYFETNDQPNDYSIWEGNLHHGYQSQPVEASNSLHALGGYGSPSKGSQFGWHEDDIQELGRKEASLKRSSTGDNLRSPKKKCTDSTSPSKKLKQLKSSSPAKDPQSIAAKNRRERISERLKILQDLVPNGSKVDLVTMLEKAIGYVKFLQLQVKVLATDEFWPAQGGKAPDLAQVKEAIDAILASQRDRNSSSK